MQLDVTNLTPEAHRAIVECLIIAARRGRLLREAREREQAALKAGLPQNVVLDATRQQASTDEESMHSDSRRSGPSISCSDIAVSELVTTEAKTSRA